MDYNFRVKAASLFILGLLSILLFAPGVLAQTSRAIESVDIQGNRRLTDEELLKHIKTRPGQSYHEKQLQEDLQSLLKLGTLDPTNTRVLTEEGVRGGVKVFFEVRELSLVDEIKFAGLKHTSKEKILAALREQDAEILPNTPYSPEKARKAIKVITEYLIKKRGFTNAKVYISEDVFSATNLNLTFYIKEVPENH